MVRQALGRRDRRPGDTRAEAGSEWLRGKAEAGWWYDACASAASVSTAYGRAYVRVHAGVGAEMAPRGRASGQRAEVGVRAEVAGCSRGLGGDRACR